MGNSFDRGTDSSDASNSGTPNNVRRQQQPKFSQQVINSKLSSPQKDLIRQAWNESKRTDVSARIYKRVFEKRPDLKSVFDNIGPYAWIDESKRFAEFMDGVVSHLDDMQEIERLSLDVGRRHGQWRGNGFKSEFWVIFAESMTTECLYLDAGVHPAPDVLGAWAALIGVIFNWVRDGYYEKLRVQRRLSRKSSKSTPSSSRSYSGSRTNSVDDANFEASSSSNVNIGGDALSTVSDNGGETVDVKPAPRIKWFDQQSRSVEQVVE